MSNIDTLKTELLKQKQVIESMGGYVTVANNNPSPSEITEGIKTVTGSLDLTIATATEDDVALGKTFYSGTTQLKTGISQSGDFYNLFIYGNTDADTLMTPNNVTAYRDYMFKGVSATSNFIVNSNVESFGKETFSYSNFSNFSFAPNSNLKSIGYQCFAYSSMPINMSNLPDSIETLEYNPFYYANLTNDGYLKVPRNLTTFKEYALTSYTYKEYADGINWNNSTFSTIGQYMFYNQSFTGTLTFPSNITYIKNSAFYNSRYSKVIFNSNITRLESNVYCISTSYTSRVPKLEIIFESENLSQLTACPFYYVYRVADLSIYVPDSAVETYKANQYLSNYVDYIKPMSELPE